MKKFRLNRLNVFDKKSVVFEKYSNVDMEELLCFFTR